MTHPTDPRVEAAAQALFLRRHNDLGAWSMMTDEHKIRYHETAQAVLKAADEAAWRPIETAPRDGTEIIAVGTQKSDPASPIEPYIGVVWFLYNLWQDGTIACRPVLTHWQPLPTPPTP